MRALLPLAIVSNAPNRLVKPDGTAFCDAHILTMAHALAQQSNATGVIRIFQVIVLMARTSVQRVKVDAVLQSAAFY
jgi:hypothetical protein